MIPEADATRIHHPAIRVTNTIAGKSFGLRPGSGHVTENHIHRAIRGGFITIIPPLLSNRSNLCGFVLLNDALRLPFLVVCPNHRAWPPTIRIA